MKLRAYLFTEEQMKDRMFWLRLVLAIVLTLLLVGQLFTYETFYEVLVASHSNLGPIGATLLMVLLPIYELAALPSLLSMNLSRDFVRLSAYVARTVGLLIAAMALNALVVAPGASTGILGGTLAVPAGAVSLLATIVFAGAVWLATTQQVERTKDK